MNRRTMRAKAFANKLTPVVVQLMDELQTNKQIAESLNDMGCLTPRGLEWNLSSVSSFIHKNNVHPTAQENT